MMQTATTTQKETTTRPVGKLLVVAGIALTLLIIGFVAIDHAFFAGGIAVLREGGGLETVSVLLYGVATALFLILAPRDRWADLFHVPAITVLFAMRELDFDKRFTEPGVLQLRLYSGDNPLATKLISAAVVVFIVFVAFRIVWRGTPAVWRAFRSGEIWQWFAIGAVLLVVMSKMADGLQRKLTEFGIPISENAGHVALVVEETGEAYIPVCIILAILARWKGRNA